MIFLSHLFQRLKGADPAAVAPHQPDNEKKQLKPIDEKSHQAFFQITRRNFFSDAVSYLVHIYPRKRKWVLISEDQQKKVYAQADFLKEKLGLTRSELKNLVNLHDSKKDVLVQKKIVKNLTEWINTLEPGKIIQAVRDKDNKQLIDWTYEVKNTQFVLEILGAFNTAENRSLRRKVLSLREELIEALELYQGLYGEDNILQQLSKELQFKDQDKDSSVDPSIIWYKSIVFQELYKLATPLDREAYLAGLILDTVVSNNNQELLALIDLMSSCEVNVRNCIEFALVFLEHEHSIPSYAKAFLERILNKSDVIQDHEIENHGLDYIQTLRICVIAELCLQQLSEDDHRENGAQLKGALYMPSKESIKTSEEGIFYINKHVFRKLDRSLVLAPSDKEFMILTKSKAPASELGRGAYKKITSLVAISECAEGQLAEATLRVQAAPFTSPKFDQREIQFFRWFKDIPNLISVHSVFDYNIGKNRGGLKQTYFQEICDYDLIGFIHWVYEEFKSEEDRFYYLNKVLLDIARGLDVMHDFKQHGVKNGLVHGDIKFDNILIKYAEDGTFEAKISDFGWTFEPGSNEGLTRIRCYGTPDYTAPEVLENGRHSNNPKHVKAEDMYALGASLYQIIFFGQEPPWMTHLDELRNCRFPSEKWKENVDKTVDSQKFELRSGSLKDGADLQSRKEAGEVLSFKEELLLITYQLLQVDPEHRLTSKELLQRMEEINSRY